MRKLIVLFLACASSAFALRADINADGRVDFGDFVVLAEEWLMENDMANQYLQFDGVTGHITIPDNEALNVGDENFSFSLWIRPGRTGESQGIFGKYRPPDNGPPIVAARGYTILYHYYDAVAVNCEGANFGSLSLESEPLSVGVWYHLAFTVDWSGDISLYLNGVEVDSMEAPQAGSLDNEEDAYIGDLGEAYLTVGGYSGGIDGLFIYKKALSGAEVLAIYNGGKGKKYSASDAGAASAAWNMDEGTGTTVTDAVGELVGTFSETGITWQSGGVPFGGAGAATTVFFQDK